MLKARNEASNQAKVDAAPLGMSDASLVTLEEDKKAKATRDIEALPQGDIEILEQLD